MWKNAARSGMVNLCAVAGLAALLGASAHSFASSSAPLQEAIEAKTVRAQEFVLVDKAGKSWGKMRVGYSQDGAVLTLGSPGKGAQASVLVAGNRSSISVQSAGESKSSVLIVATEEGVMIGLSDRKGLGRGLMEIRENSMGISFCDSKDVAYGNMYFNEDGTGGFKLFDRKGKVVWQAPPK